MRTLINRLLHLLTSFLFIWMYSISLTQRRTVLYFCSHLYTRSLLSDMKQNELNDKWDGIPLVNTIKVHCYKIVEATYPAVLAHMHFKAKDVSTLKLSSHLKFKLHSALQLQLRANKFKHIRFTVNTGYKVSVQVGLISSNKLFI